MNPTVTFEDVLKKLINQTTQAGKPTALIKGEVTSVNPVTVKVEGRFEISAPFLELTHNVKDYYVDITVSHTTENRSGGAGDAEFQSHNHDYKGRKKILIHNGLQVGEFVWLIRQEGGQVFVVLDRINEPTCSGQWG